MCKLKVAKHCNRSHKGSNSIFSSENFCSWSRADEFADKFTNSEMFGATRNLEWLDFAATVSSWASGLPSPTSSAASTTDPSNCGTSTSTSSRRSKRFTTKESKWEIGLSQNSKFKIFLNAGKMHNLLSLGKHNGARTVKLIIF